MLTAAQREFVTTATKIFLAKRQNAARRLFYRMYPDEDLHLDDGTVLYAREKYPKHLEFFDAGSTYRERCAMCANRVGKTFGMGGYEMTAHLTGEYPDWWTGKRFRRPIRAWAAGKSNETTRDIVQKTLVGDVIDRGGRKAITGTGLVPGHLLSSPAFKTGFPDLIDTIRVKHVPTGGWSTLGFKSYQQGRDAYEGTAQHVIWFDEEVPEDIYGEGLIRTATVFGILMLTFTPMEGLTNVAASFLGQEDEEDNK